MKIFIPYSSEELAREFLAEAARQAGVRIEIEFVSKHRIKNRAPGVPNVPHNEFRVRLHLQDERYRKLSVRPWEMRRIRKVNAVCWHGYRTFFTVLFFHLDIEATIRAGRNVKIEYMGGSDFVAKYARTKFEYYDGYSACRCSGNELSSWELATDHFPPGDFIRKTG